MSDRQVHFERQFYQDKKTGYWISTTAPRIRAHVWVWQNVYCKVPAGCHVHHKDGNKSNNSIENLELMERSRHLSYHALDPEKRRIQKELADKYRPLTKEWHKSPEGSAWHKLHGIRTWNDRKPFKINCLFCQAEIMTKTYHHRFCNQNCKAKYSRRKNKLELPNRES